ncbi:MAG: hypothetical protein RMI56_01580 [Sulfolobales archaeon]|nr:hypothetical protein [Sulfolobales archaeon]MDW8082469.1 hypothetical protein [Sulfolobales archaeon]
MREEIESVAEIYDVLYSVRRAGFYRVLKDIVERGIRRRTSALQKLRTIVKLHEEDVIRLRLDYYIHMIKLGIEVVYLTKNIDCVKLPQTIPFLRSCVNTIPTGTILTFYCPKHLRPRELDDVGVRHYTFYERIFSKAEIGYYINEITENPLSLFSQKKLEEHFTKELKRGSNSEDILKLGSEVRGIEIPSKIDNKDLRILGSIELDPLTTVSLDVKLDMKKELLSKHIEHVESILRGIRIRKIGSIMNVSRAAFMAIISGRDGHLLKLVNSILKYPTSISAAVSSDLQLAMTQVLVPGDIDTVRNIALALKKASLDYDLELVESYLVDLTTLVNFTAPFIRELEYSPITRDWLNKSIRRALKYIKGRGK